MSKNFLAIIITFFLSLFVLTQSFACTNFIITKGASTDGSCMITYAADSQNLYGELYYYASADYPEGAMLKVYEWDTGKFLGEIKQVRHTYSVIGNMNEHQLAIGETTYTGRKELQDTTGIIDYGSLIYITLQRAKTAREAIKVMNELVSEYGYYSTGESFSIADANEVWIMDFIGKGVGNKGAVWVARRVPDGYISGHANKARITTFPLDDPENCLYSKDLISFAKEKAYFTGKDEDFSFVDAYAPVDYGALRFCDARVWSMFRRVCKDTEKYIDYVTGVTGAEVMPLWVKPDKKISAHDVMNLMRDHFNASVLDMNLGEDAGDFGLPYRWRPLVWEIDSVKYAWERSTSTPQTGFSFVAQARSYLPDPIGGILWFGLDDTDMTVYMPMYCGMKGAPKCIEKDNGSLNEFTWDASFWAFNFVSNYVYSRYKDMIEDVRSLQTKLELQFFEDIKKTDEEAKKLYASDPKSAIEYITSFSKTQAQSTHTRWIEFGKELLTKYLDGYKKDEKGVAQYFGYSEKFYRATIAERGEDLRMKDYANEEIKPRTLESNKKTDLTKDGERPCFLTSPIMMKIYFLLIGLVLGYFLFRKAKK